MVERGPVEVVICFAIRAVDLERGFHAAMGRIPASGAIWTA
jgi:hypothetical protein